MIWVLLKSGAKVCVIAISVITLNVNESSMISSKKFFAKKFWGSENRCTFAPSNFEAINTAQI